MHGRTVNRCLTVLLLGFSCFACDRRADPQHAAWERAQEAWAQRLPGAWARWRDLGTATIEGKEATRRLDEARSVYEEGVASLERGDPRASETLGRGAAIAPLEPALYLRLARACRERGATVRAADFYRKYLAELDSSTQDPAVEAELAALGTDLAQVFAPPSETSRWPLWLAAAVLSVAAIAVLSSALYRRRRLRLAAFLGRHPERAASFAYLAGTLRHELIKHRIAPLRSEGGGRVPPTEPIERAWRRHIDALGAALGLRAPWVAREPLFRAADAAIVRLGRDEQRDGKHAPDRDALATLAALDRALVDWCRLARRTRIDAALVDGLLRSLKDEQPGGRLGVEVEVVLAPRVLYASIFHDDLLLVLRNLGRNAIEAASATEQPRIRIETDALLDETGEEWVRIAIHDPSTRRPDRAQRGSDRGLGIVRDTLERYGGALVELPAASGFEKALAVSLPLAEESAPSASAREAA